MVISSLLQIFIIALTGFSNGRPPWLLTFPASVSQEVQYLYALDPIIPVSEVVLTLTFTCSLFVVINFTKWGVKILDYVADVIP